MPFFMLITTTGKAKLAAATAGGAPVALTQMALGDGGGAAVTPVENRAALVGEVNRGPLNSLSTDPLNPNWLIAERIIPPEVGGWTVREIGLIDAAGDLFAYGNFPESYKPILAEGSGKELIIRAIAEVTNAIAVTLQIDPTVVMASRAYVDGQVADTRAYVNAQDAAQWLLHRARRHYFATAR